MTLADKVDDALNHDHGVFEHRPVLNGIECDTFELDLIDWGMVYGLAFGIARGEDPLESDESVGKRAAEAAKDAWVRFAEQFPTREIEAVPA